MLENFSIRSVRFDRICVNAHCLISRVCVFPTIKIKSNFYFAIIGILILGVVYVKIDENSELAAKILLPISKKVCMFLYHKSQNLNKFISDEESFIDFVNDAQYLSRKEYIFGSPEILQNFVNYSPNYKKLHKKLKSIENIQPYLFHLVFKSRPKLQTNSESPHSLKNDYFRNIPDPKTYLWKEKEKMRKQIPKKRIRKKRKRDSRYFTIHCYI